MNKDELIAAGFEKYEPRSTLDRFDALYSMRVKDEFGIRYAVHIRFWSFRQYGAEHDGWDVELVSNDGAEWWGGPLWLKTSCADRSVAEVMEWADQMWNRLALKHYERWDDE